MSAQQRPVSWRLLQAWKRVWNQLGHFRTHGDYATHLPAVLPNRSFLFCEGGAGTQYARAISANHWASGETIQPLLYAEAREWAETYLSADKFEPLFGEIAEDSSTTPVTLCLTKAARTALEREQSRTGKTASGIVSELIAANL